MMIFRQLIAVLLVIGAITGSPVQAQEKQPPAAPVEMQEPGWLGVWVERMPEVLKAQLAPLAQADEGLLVTRVEKDSPAERAGISKFDVILSFDGQKLYNPEQLSRLVASIDANNQVELTLVHQGQLKTINTRLAQRKQRTLARTHRSPWWGYPPAPRFNPQPPPMSDIPDESNVWEKFESVEVKTLPDGRYRAVVSFRDNSNETRTFTFEGKKQEIIQQIEQLQELPPDKKRALLKALKFRPDQLNSFDRYGFTRDLFDSPLWQQNPFDHPFFRNPYFMNRFNSDPWWRDGYRQPWQLHLYPDMPDWKHRRDWNGRR